MSIFFKVDWRFVHLLQKLIYVTDLKSYIIKLINLEVKKYGQKRGQTYI